MKPLEQTQNQRIVIGVILASLAPFLAVELFRSQLYRVMDILPYLVFHNVTEVLSVIVSFSIFGIGWYAFDQNKDRHALYLSVAFITIGVIDLAHTLSYEGMPALTTPNSPNKASQFWIAVRLFSAAAFLSSAFIYPGRSYRWLTKNSLVFSALAIAALIFTGVIFFPGYVPVAFVQGVGQTPFKLISEYVIVALMLLAAIAYWQRLSRSGNGAFMYYLAAFVLCIFSELVFTRYKSAFDSYNMLGHLYKTIAFLLIYKGIFVTAVRRPYEELHLKSAMLTNIIDSVPQSIFWKDRKNVYLGCNQVLARRAGLAN